MMRMHFFKQQEDFKHDLNYNPELGCPEQVPQPMFTTIIVQKGLSTLELSRHIWCNKA